MEDRHSDRIRQFILGRIILLQTKIIEYWEKFVLVQYIQVAKAIVTFT